MPRLYAVLFVLFVLAIGVNTLVAGSAASTTSREPEGRAHVGGSKPAPF